MADLILDTNAAIAYINGDKVVQNLLGQAQSVSVPIIVVGELYFGAEKSGRVADNLQQIEGFLDGRTIHSCTVDAARIYGRIVQQLRLKGTPIPQNDMWIAAIARQHDLTLLTQDAHFSNVDGLNVQGW
jgi:tRNA(fMet)-specific endonuclease VapC